MPIRKAVCNCTREISKLPIHEPICKHTKGTPKVMPPILLCWPTMSEVDTGGMAVEDEPSHQ
jgi:hypothetical protein